MNPEEKMTSVSVEQATGHPMKSRSKGVKGSDAAEVAVRRGMGAAHGRKWTARFSVEDGSRWLVAGRAAGETPTKVQEDKDCTLLPLPCCKCSTFSILKGLLPQ